jgi:hypothetical protein
MFHDALACNAAEFQELHESGLINWEHVLFFSQLIDALQHRSSCLKLQGHDANILETVMGHMHDMSAEGISVRDELFRISQPPSLLLFASTRKTWAWWRPCFFPSPFWLACSE